MTAVNDKRGGLVLTRRVGDSIYVEHGLLEIQVVRIRGKEVRLKFIGNVQINRSEHFADGLEAGARKDTP